jgi:hypothetical protein
LWLLLLLLEFVLVRQHPALLEVFEHRPLRFLGGVHLNLGMVNVVVVV